MDTKVIVTPQFDLCFALADLASPQPHFSGWPGLDGTPDWLEEARSFGWGFWLGLPDLIESPRPAQSTAEFVQALAEVPAETALPRLRRGLLHVTPSGKSSAQTREWLHFIGLDSGESEERMASRWTRPIDAPLEIVNAFRKHFDPVWEALLPVITASAEDVAEQARTIRASALAHRLNLAMEIDERAGMMRALRGGYKWSLKDVGNLYLPPSAFNSRRVNVIAEYMSPIDVYIPYYLPDIALPFGMRRQAGTHEAVDPWIVCRAMGDASRAAILRLIADRPRPASELLEELGLSKATVSHHIFQLRQAGLITERRVGRTLELAIRLDPVRTLSRALVRELNGRRGH